MFTSGRPNFWPPREQPAFGRHILVKRQKIRTQFRREQSAIRRIWSSGRYQDEIAWEEAVPLSDGLRVAAAFVNASRVALLCLPCERPIHTINAAARRARLHIPATDAVCECVCRAASAPRGPSVRHAANRAAQPVLLTAQRRQLSSRRVSCRIHDLLCILTRSPGRCSGRARRTVHRRSPGGGGST